MEIVIGKPDEEAEQPLHLWLDKSGDEVILMGSRYGRTASLLLVGPKGGQAFIGVPSELGLPTTTGGVLAPKPGYRTI